MTKGHWAALALVGLSCAACAAPPPQPPTIPSTKYIGLPRGYEECLVSTQGGKEAALARCRHHLEAYTSPLAISADAKNAIVGELEQRGAGVLAPVSTTAPATEAHKKRADVWAACTVGKIREIDDGVASPATVAIHVISTCRRLYDGPKDEDVTLTVEAVFKIRAAGRSKDPIISPPTPMPPSELRL